MNRVPKKNEEYKEMKINTWFKDQKERITSKDSDLYRRFAENSLVKESIDTYLETKGTGKARKTFNESMAILFEFCEVHQRMPKLRECYKDSYPYIWYKDQRQKINSKDHDIYVKLSQNEYVKKHLNESWSQFLI